MVKGSGFECLDAKKKTLASVRSIARKLALWANASPSCFNDGRAWRLTYEKHGMRKPRVTTKSCSSEVASSSLDRSIPQTLASRHATIESILARPPGIIKVLIDCICFNHTRRWLELGCSSQKVSVNMSCCD